MKPWQFKTWKPLPGLCKGSLFTVDQWKDSVTIVQVTHRWRPDVRQWRWGASRRSGGAWCGIGRICIRLPATRPGCATRRSEAPCTCRLEWFNNHRKKNRLVFVLSSLANLPENYLIQLKWNSFTCRKKKHITLFSGWLSFKKKEKSSNHPSPLINLKNFKNSSFLNFKSYTNNCSFVTFWH